MDTVLQIGLSNAVSATVLALLAAGVGCFCRPALRHSLWLLVLIKLITPSLLPVAAPWPEELAFAEASVTDPPIQENIASEGRAGGVSPRILPAPPAEENLRGLTPPARPFVFAIDWRPLALAVWLGGAACWWLLTSCRIRRFQRLLRHARPAPTELRKHCHQLAQRLGLIRTPDIRFVPGPLSPMLWAVGRTPRLLLPADLWGRLTDDQRDSLLLHELAHLRRRDHWVRRLELLVLGLYWWHPVAWWARRELQAAEEECCDAWVVWARPEAAPAYASALVETLTFISQARSALPLPASGIGHARPLKRRLTMILSGNTSRALTWGGRFAVLALAAALLPLLPTWAEPPKGERQETTANDGDQGQVFNFWMGYFSESGDAARSDSPAAIAAPRTLRQALAQQIEAAQDEVELLQAQLDAKRAQLQAAKIELDSATKQLARLRRSSGVPEVAAAAEGKINTMRAQVVIKEAELKEPEIRLKQARRRLEKLREQAARADGKRQTGQAQQGRNGNSEARHKGLEARLAIAQSDLEMWEERAAWSARMAKRGLVTEPQAKADAAKLRAAKTTYDKLREELHSSANKDADKEKRLADLEKKLDALMKEIESLRRELKRPQSALPPGQPFNVNPFAEGQPYQIVPAPKVPGSAVPNPEFKVVPYDPTRPNPKYADPRDTPTVPLKPPTGEPRQH